LTANARAQCRRRGDHDEVADLLELEEANPFRVRARRNAARVVRDLNRGLADMVRQKGDLTELPGIGDDLAGQIEEIIRRGTCPTLRNLQSRIPAVLTRLLQVPGPGPKRARSLPAVAGSKPAIC
jgi:DNA polymerase (family 10)